jgi:hypothetical protein
MRSVRSRVLWSCWALVPVVVAAYHFGPGQLAWKREQAAALLAQASTLEAEAEAAQSRAYELHLLSLKARRDATADASATTAAKRAQEAEEAAYAQAASAWSTLADTLEGAVKAVAEQSPSQADRYRWSRGRALIRAGRLESGIDELEELVEKLDASERDDASKALARNAREDLATGRYYKARIMRLGGAKPADWREEASKARQQFRYLAETAADRGDSSEQVLNHQRNVEVVLNLEQSGLTELEGKPRPKDAPQGNREGDRPGKKGKSNRPPNRKDARGAGGAGEMGPGW